MNKVNAIVITGYGTNSHIETAHAVRLGGADAVDIVHFADLVSEHAKLSNYNFLIFPGGFLDGDDLGAGQAGAKRWMYMADSSGNFLIDELKKFIAHGGLVLGICNGFQMLVKLGVLPGLSSEFGKPVFKRDVTLGHNDSAKFEDRWVSLLANPNSPCVFTKNISQVAMPVRHGEGKFIAKDKYILDKIVEKNLIALQYADCTTNMPTEKYPDNPNGSPYGIAGITDPTGRILGLMPHPEAYTHVTNLPLWTRGQINLTTGLCLFKNAVSTLRSGE